MREYTKKHYMDLLKKTLGNKKMTLKEIMEKSGLSRSTALYYLNLFNAMGYVREEFKERKKYFIWVKQKNNVSK